MTKRLRLLVASLAITTAAATGTLLTTILTLPPDTTWGAPAGQDDTTWGTTPVDLLQTPTVPVVTPQDTTWG
jgi:hypothetical protein